MFPIFSLELEMEFRFCFEPVFVSKYFFYTCNIFFGKMTACFKFENEFGRMSFACQNFAISKKVSYFIFTVEIILLKFSQSVFLQCK